MRLSESSVQLARSVHGGGLLVNGRPAVRIRSPAPRSWVSFRTTRISGVDRAARSRDMASDPAGRCWPRWHAEPADMCRNFGLDRPRLVSAWTATGARNAAAGPGWVCPGPAAVGSGLCVGHQVLLSVCGCACQLTVVSARRVRDRWRAGGGCAGQAGGPRVRGGRLGPCRRLEMSRRWPSAFS